MPRKKRNRGLTEEQLAVLRISPNLKPCKKFRKVRTARFVEHLNEGKCKQCLAFFRMLERDQQLMQFLRDTRN